MHDETLIEPSEGPAFAVLRPGGASDVVLICEHASKTMPKSLGTLGLDGAALESHIAWDIGAERVAELVSERLDAALVLQRFSRLAYDCNRPPESSRRLSRAKRDLSRSRAMPGSAARTRRAGPGHCTIRFIEAIDALIDARLAQGRSVVLAHHPFVLRQSISASRAKGFWEYCTMKTAGSPMGCLRQPRR